MKRLLLVVLAGLGLAGAGYFAVYSAGTACCRDLQQSAAPGLAWLKQEFKLSEGEFERIVKLHDAYEPACAERCRKIDALNARLRELIVASGAVTPELERTLAAAADLRRECQAAMLQHFIEVSRAMPPEQGKRYLDWVCARTLGPAHEAMASVSGSAPTHEHHGD